MAALVILTRFLAGLGVLADVVPEKSSSANWAVIVAIVVAVVVVVAVLGYLIVRRRRSQ